MARETPQHHKAIWVVHPDGAGLRQLQIDRACGGPLGDPEFVGCYSPGWSPDGTKIVFTGSEPDGDQENIYTVNADGTGLLQVTDGGADDFADWGTHPTT